MQKIHALVVCPSTKGYTDQQMIAGRAIHASYSWLNRERDEIGNHKERRLARSGPTLTAAITPVVLTKLDLKQQAELLPLTYVAQYTPLFVRPEHPTTARERKPSGIKQEIRSPGAPGQELEGEYEGSIPERSFISTANHVRAHVKGFAERLRALWKGVADRVHQLFIPRKAPMIFRWHSNSAWNPREWITKRLNMRQKGGYWDNEELCEKVRSIADPFIERKRRGATKAKDLQDEITYLFNEAVRSDKESHILGWMVLLSCYCICTVSWRKTQNGVYHLYTLKKRCLRFLISYTICLMILAMSLL